MKPSDCFFGSMLIQTLVGYCFTKTCPLNSITRTLDMLSTQTRSRVDLLTSPHLDTSSAFGIYNWTKINHHNHNDSLTNQDTRNTRTVASALAAVFSNILEERIQREVLIITDLNSNDIFFSEFTHHLSNYYLDIQTISSKHLNLHAIENIVLQIFEHHISLILFLLPNDIASLVLQQAERNFLLTKEHKLTWIGLNVKELQPRFPRVVNVDMSAIFKTMSFDQKCNLNSNMLSIKDLSLRILGRILSNEKITSELVIASVADKPFLQTSETDFDPLGGYTCLTGYICSAPFHLTNSTIVWRRQCCSGLVIDILKEIKLRLNMNFRIYLCPDGQYGGVNANGSWTGLINEVYSGRADVAIQGLTVTAQRSKVVDFTERFMLTSIGILRRKTAVEIPVVNWEFLKTLEADLMFGLVALFVVVVIFMFGLENLIYFAFRGKYYPTREAFSYVAGLTFQRDLAGKTPTKWSARYVAILYAVALTIVMTTYTANLTANNITNTIGDDFEGLQDQRISNPTPAFIYGARKGTSTELYFKNNIQPRLNRAYRVHIKNYITQTNQEGIHNVFTGAFDAFVGDYVYLLYQLVKPQYCSVLTLHKESFLDFPLAFAVQKNSKWKYLLSTIIRDLQDLGDLQDIVKKWFFLPQCLEETAQANKFPWEYIGGMLLAVAVFVVISIAVVLMETTYTKQRSKSRTEIPPPEKTKRLQNIVSKRMGTIEECIENPHADESII